MHALLNIADRIERLRRRTDNVAPWCVRAVFPVGDWTFDHVPIFIGEQWPDREGQHRFRCARFAVPDAWDLAHTRLELDMGGESLLHVRFDSGATYCAGIDPFHQSFPLSERCGAVETESVARGLLAQPEPDPRLRKAQLVLFHPALDELVRMLRLVGDTAETLADHEVASSLLILGEEALARVKLPTATAAVLSRAPDMSFLYNGPPREGVEYDRPLDGATLATVDHALSQLRTALGALQQRYPAQGSIALIGHAHIDAAWLWTLDETRRKVRRSFATAANLLDARPEFRFAQSFAEYYRYLETDDPQLFARVQRHIAAGRWEPVGGMWVEPDVVMPTGESLARQLLYGQHYFKRMFGAYHRVAWLPDTFGFSPALPQILRQAGIEAMFTVKLGWSETNRFPHARFWWEGLDGSRVLVNHFVNRETGFNGAVEPARLMRVWRNHADKHFAPETLYPIGYGDGGGGPTLEMVENRDRLSLFPVLPKLRFTTADAFFDEVRTQSEEGIACWSGELYLEFHRGVLTSQGRTKSLHRRAERDLITAEMLACAAHLLGAPAPASLEHLWRPLMVNQFHDILPGSSITEVHAQSEVELGDLVAEAGALIKSGFDVIAACVVGPGDSEALLVVNPDVNDRPVRLFSNVPLPGGQLVDGGHVFCSDATAAGLAASILRPEACREGATASARWLENSFVRVELADDGTIARLFDKIHGREVLDGPGNQIIGYRDQPRFFDAWDIEEDYEQVAERAELCEPIHVTETGPHRASIRVARKVANTHIVQHIRLWASSPRLDFRTEIDCSDRQLMLKAVFPLAVRAEYASFECAFGVQKRPTHRNTSWDAARFEVSAHRFADLSETGYGVALLNDGRYGYHARASELGITLLRSPIAPAPFADEGRQSFGYALFPHAADARAVLAEAEDFNRALLGRPVRTEQFGATRFLECSGATLALSALKPCEDGRGLVLRAYEPFGARGPVSLKLPDGWHLAGNLDLLEEAVPCSDPVMRPFEVRSWRLGRARPDTLTQEESGDA